MLQNVERLEFTDRTVQVSDLVAEARAAAQAAPAPVVEAPQAPVVNLAPVDVGSPADGLADSLAADALQSCLLYTSPSPRDATLSRMPSSA